ncbi:hypothetical protein HNR19_001321 [Nocardioides thalensis]|uniref:Squalene cyclase C-terminal domain-containing protein n=1 Tax=Nocardioides thalensis TaxID=1914755 RepID=A0A853C2R1_9ACTN|nr:prenyltransferase/squalene oxidase repeat-containing protein [Nocardioides thalensis]NYJ00623.1 hypothetical protein [Nocardioides thalensis]
MSSPSFKRAGAAAVGAAILAAGLTAVAPAPAAHAATDPGPAADAAGWLADEFATLTSDEAGEAIDYGLAVAATDGPAEVLTSLTNGLNGVLADFLPPADPAPSQWTAINVAMAADYYATVDAIPPAETDLFNRFAGMVDDTTGQFGPSAWPYSQAYAVNALRNRNSAELEEARDFLLEAQCENGAWGFDTSCAAGTLDIDGTALAVLALLPDAELAAVGPAVESAIAWMKTQQRADGGFGNWGVNTGGTTSSGPSSGLAGWALGAAGETAIAGEAAVWIRNHQAAAVTGCATLLDAESGAVAFDGDGYDEGTTEGIGDAVRGSWLNSTAQAYGALTFLPEHTDHLGLGVPLYLDGGSTHRFVVSGLREGERACFKIGKKRTWVRGNAHGKATVNAQVPDRTGFIGVTAATADDGAGGETAVLAAKRVPFDLKDRVRRGGKQVVEVRGLHSGERVVVRYDGAKVAGGKAATDGTFRASFPVGRKAGAHKVKVVGQFADRTATQSFLVG